MVYSKQVVANKQQVAKSAINTDFTLSKKSLNLLFCSFSGRIICAQIKQTIGELTMKIIAMMVLLASLFAIAGAALFQLFVLLTSSLFAKQDDSRQPSRQS